MSTEPESAPVPPEGNPSAPSSSLEDLAKISLTNFPASVQDQFRRLLHELERKRDGIGKTAA